MQPDPVRPMTTFRTRTAAQGWSDWSRRVHGKGWPGEGGWGETKRRYWSSRWTLARCLWCRARRGLQLNHLTYAFSMHHPVHGPGYIPAPLRHVALVPLCGRCHRAETWITRKVFRSLTGRFGAHVLATFVPYLAIRAAVLGAVLVLLSLVGCSSDGGPAKPVISGVTAPHADCISDMPEPGSWDRYRLWVGYIDGELMTIPTQDAIVASFSGLDVQPLFLCPKES